jgi:hypothetical protein
MQVKKRLRALTTAVLFVATGATTVLACTDGGYPATACNWAGSAWVLWSDACGVTCGAGSYACCDPGSCVCIMYNNLTQE